MGKKLNKGEWSEAYTLIKLLADGKLYAADSDLNKINNIYYPLIKILRTELLNNVTKNYEYLCDSNTNIKIVDGNTGNSIIDIPVQEFKEHSLIFFQDIVNGKGRSFEVSHDIEQFLNKLIITKKSERSDKKRDITIVVHDIITGFEPTLGFSIKSKVGKPATLLNASGATHFLYKFEGSKTLSSSELQIINSDSAIKDRIQSMINEGFQIKFIEPQNSTFNLNMQMIDSSFPTIISQMLLYYYQGIVPSRIDKLVEKLEQDNPCNFDLSSNHPFYRYKIKNFLIDVSLGLMPSEVWNGIYDANGGYIIVRDDGELVCYHIYNRDEFQEFLLKNTRLEQADRGRHRFGEVFENNGEYFIKLNLQIRFR
ncbi:HpaII family restriction endonuclease [Bacillus mobilis]|uniref:HpaII family restriction endonuclease n=1 Tax=Bacillus cereus group TaxID=86661 RepID=UPI0022E3C4A8|nr:MULTISPECIES: HpaII family restriction endonuclease [unclassified Bacillus cereus group]MCU5461573.1 HpaII family restriction endonuclease [Bacillus cereus]MDA1615826.1 HpaII family restriction endonuclease [Bacillus cereus group sp. TH204-1LC]MDX5819873.1 HpaII family restriction endonuclease [Bacillus cereus group sp. BfR-BA-02490]MDX5881797.1 HpaII family restriction endonuclease [Bacillus cereus group sp. BfR-BA-00999]HDR4581913.1 HpaII family restriction endonuclease [Bacillus cereus]